MSIPIIFISVAIHININCGQHVAFNYPTRIALPLNTNLPIIRPQHIVVVDYDNLEKAIQARGLRYLITQVLTRVFTHGQGLLPCYHFRLYGGWYEGRTPTSKAQHLARSISKDIPLPFPFTANNLPIKIPLTIELAYALAAMPAKHLLATYRRRSPQHSLSCHHPTTVGCHNIACPIQSVHTLITTERCPDQSCTLTLEQLLFRPEQKLVDSMMLTDLIFYAQQNATELSLVSSDDDLWPGIIYALHTGSVVNHIQTRRGPKDRYGYSSSLSKYRATSPIYS